MVGDFSALRVVGGEFGPLEASAAELPGGLGRIGFTLIPLAGFGEGVLGAQHGKLFNGIGGVGQEGRGQEQRKDEGAMKAKLKAQSTKLKKSSVAQAPNKGWPTGRRGCVWRGDFVA